MSAERLALYIAGSQELYARLPLEFTVKSLNAAVEVYQDAKRFRPTSRRLVQGVIEEQEFKFIRMGF